MTSTFFMSPQWWNSRNGQTVAVPQLGTNLAPGDYEICDPQLGESLAIRPWCWHRQHSFQPWAGRFAQTSRGCGISKNRSRIDGAAASSARLSTSRYYGTNNVFLDPASPITNNAISGNGEEDVATESASLALFSGVTPTLTSHLRAQFSRDLQQSFPNANRSADQYLQLASGLWAVIDIAAPDPGTPPAFSRNIELEPRTKRVEVRRRRDVDLGL